MSSALGGYGQVPSVPGNGSTNLADILERVLNTGIVIAGDIKVNLLDIELLTIQVRLLVVSVDRAEQMGIDWWRSDPALCSAARPDATRPDATRPAGTRRQPVLGETP